MSDLRDILAEAIDLIMKDPEGASPSAIRVINLLSSLDIESALQAERRRAIEEAVQYMCRRALELDASSTTPIGKAMGAVYRSEAEGIRALLSPPSPPAETNDD